jgi:Xaa-Pro aminopeptidase
MAGLRDGLRAGLTERELGDLVEREYVALGGTNVIHFIGVTPMHAPALGVPTQFPSTRKVQAGDIVFAEISAAFWDHPGQVLRSFAVGGEPPPLYCRLHDVADAAFDAIAGLLRAGVTPAQVIEASGVIEDAGFTIIDDLLHSYGGGYFPPILRSKSTSSGPVPEEPFEAGMTVVIQPNVATPDGMAGVQTRRARADHRYRRRAHARVPERICAGVILTPPSAHPPASRRSASATCRRGCWRCDCHPR